MNNSSCNYYIHYSLQNVVLFNTMASILIVYLLLVYKMVLAALHVVNLCFQILLWFGH